MASSAAPQPESGSGSGLTAQEVLDRYNARTMSYTEELDLKIAALNEKFIELSKVRARAKWRRLKAGR